MVLIQNERKLMMMRPYQVYAVKAIVDCIHENRGNGYIWHTTGSGKTLTSFKASTLLKDNPDIEKCLFVVDRKDLDKQTRDEFNRFQPGCVEENTNTETLVQRLLSDDYRNKVIVTTIQKLGLALDGTNKRQYRERLDPLREKRIVFIFDECHRSQFGENHKAIKEFFPNAQLFGFTGTPIFEKNASAVRIEGEEARLMTTQEVFQQELHAYTITHAIEDGNVLRFHVDYFKPEGAPIKPGETLAKRAVVEAILDKHDAATNQRKFNALFATAKIDDAIEYFHLFKEIQADRAAASEEFIPLNIACVFSPPAEGNRDVLGCSVSLSEAEVHWRAFLSELKDRGLHGLELIVSDAHEGLKAARKAVFPSVPWQRCQFHLQQNAGQYVPKMAMRAPVAADIRAIFNAPDQDEAEHLLQKVLVRYQKTAPKLVEWAEEAIPEGFTVFSLPASHRRRLRTTNLVERLNQEIRRRTRVARLFPNEAACLRLVSAILMEISEDWQTADKRYVVFDDENAIRG